MMTKSISKVPNEAEIEGLASSYDAGTFINEHSHAAHQIVHAISGTMRVRVSDATWFMPPGRGLWVPAHVLHSIHCLRRVEMRTVYLGGNHPSVGTNVKVISVSPLMRELLVRLSEGCKDRQIPHLKSLLLDEIAVMDVEQLRLPVPKDVRIARIVSYFLENPTKHHSLENWAKRLGFSQRNLIRCIRAETGMSFRELRRQTRVMLAIEKLSDGRSVTNTALDVGFETTSAFIHAFHLITGSTPGKYIS
jgi:AraC-like DNA-binding protein